MKAKLLIDQLMDFKSFYEKRSAEIRDEIGELEKKFDRYTDLGLPAHAIHVKLGELNDELEFIQGRKS